MRSFCAVRSAMPFSAVILKCQSPFQVLTTLSTAHADSTDSDNKHTKKVYERRLDHSLTGDSQPCVVL
jgi:hypothetical protein